MNLCFVCIFFPCCKIFFDVNALYSVIGYDVKITDGFIVFRRITCGNNDKSIRYTMIAKRLILQELKHCRCKCFRYTIDFVKE